MTARDLLTRIREYLTVPDDDWELRALLHTYEACRTRDEKAAGARFVADRLDEMAATASRDRADRLHDEAAQWRSLFPNEKG